MKSPFSIDDEGNFQHSQYLSLQVNTKGQEGGSDSRDSIYKWHHIPDSENWNTQAVVL